MTNSDPERWGVDRGYWDVSHQWNDAPPETIERVLAAMGAAGEGPPGLAEDNPVMVLQNGERPTVEGGWQLKTEQGEVVEGHGQLPSLELGYHDVVKESGATVRVIVAPATCPSTEGFRQWGWAAQLYAMRSSHSWGIGDLGDLRSFAQMARGEEAGFVLTNPLHAALPGAPQQPSPYFPSSREFRNPIYLRVEDVPGAARADVDLGELASQARALNGDQRIDRDAAWRLKQDALERIWRHSNPGPDFDRYCTELGEPLHRYATFCAIAESHGSPWHSWPESLRHPGSAGVVAFAREHADRVRYHQWLQWLVDLQFAAAGNEISLIQDLAIGVDPAGADAWLWQDALALNVRVGAPPDEFNQKGQDWGLPPFDPWRLRSLRFDPFIHTLRANLRNTGGLRIDHVMGLFRLFWIPEGCSAAEGTYVRYPWQEMLGIVALESQRARAHIVGEDLGTVEDFMREELARRNILSYRLLWFEPDPPQKFPASALAAVTTHDLPTIAGLWSGSDLEQQHRLGMHPNEASTAQMLERVSGWVNVPENAPLADVTDAAHELLAQAPSVMVAATLEDTLQVQERPNYPGTVDEWPNWSVALPVALEDLADHDGFKRTAASLRSGRKMSQ